MVYQKNKARSITMPGGPSLTDQAGAKDTDLNIIVGQFLRNGTAPGHNRPDISGDYTNVPSDLREMIETSRSLKRYQRDLPAALQELPVTQLINMTPEELKRILTPPAQPPAPQGEPK